MTLVQITLINLTGSYMRLSPLATGLSDFVRDFEALMLLRLVSCST